MKFPKRLFSFIMERRNYRFVMIFWTVLFLAFGFFLLIKSADVLVTGAAGLAEKVRIPKIIVGLTLVAFGTSAPEGTISLIASIQNNPDISVGNVIGSNIANIALVLGIAAIIRNLPVAKSTITKGVPLAILSSIVLLVIGYDHFFQNHGVTFNRLTLGDGLILLAFFVIFLYYIFGDLKAGQELEKRMEKKEKEGRWQKTMYLWLSVLGGLAGIMVGGKLVVDNAAIIGRSMGVSEALIGLTLVALGTSLPELVTAVVASYKRENDIAVGTIIGSNIFNVFLVLGITSVLSPLEFNPTLVIDALVSLFIIVVLYVLILRPKELRKSHGYILVLLYAGYIVFLGYREIVVAALFNS